MKNFFRPERRSYLPYPQFLSSIKSYNWKNDSDIELRHALCVSTTDHPRCYSLLQEIIYRQTKQWLTEQQLAAAWAMEQGNIAQLPTGEGKTLAAVVTAASLALQGRHVQILVFNDYLVQRDYEQNHSIFRFCDLSCCYITQYTPLAQRRQAYQSQILYLTAKEAGFDFLRNFLCTDLNRWLPQQLDTAILDEADAQLLDEARTPLVLAKGAAAPLDAAKEISVFVSSLTKHDVCTDVPNKQVWLTDCGLQKFEAAFSANKLYGKITDYTPALLQAALEAYFLLQRDRHYLIREQKIEIIEDTTGRIAYNRRFSDFLHQAVEIKEQLPISDPTTIYHSIPLQFFLLRYDHLCGMTGTMGNSAEEVLELYGLETIKISSHRPCIRQDYPDLLFPTDAAQQEAILSKISDLHHQGQPILFCTGSVAQSEQYAALFQNKQIPCTVLNARHDATEAEMIAEAGAFGHLTISTNMAGRGVDIRLGGSQQQEREQVRAAGGLFVLSCIMNKSLRLDEQLRGRAGRQGDPGASQFFLSAEDPFLASLTEKPQRQSAEKYLRHLQRVAEAEAAATRRSLLRYAWLLELQRQKITTYREDILMGKIQPAIVQEDAPELYMSLCRCYTAKEIEAAQRHLILHLINEHWADYLATMEQVREGIHLMVIGGGNPLESYHRKAASAFLEMEQDIRQDVVKQLIHVLAAPEQIIEHTKKSSGSSTTWTYAINESHNQFSRLPQIMSSIAKSSRSQLFTLRQCWNRMRQLLYSKKNQP